MTSKIRANSNIFGHWALRKEILLVFFVVSSLALGTFQWANAVPSDGTVDSFQKISETQGNLMHVLDNSDQFGHSFDKLGDLDGDGITDLVVGADQDDDGGNGPAGEGSGWNQRP